MSFVAWDMLFNVTTLSFSGQRIEQGLCQRQQWIGVCGRQLAGLNKRIELLDERQQPGGVSVVARDVEHRRERVLIAAVERKLVDQVIEFRAHLVGSGELESTEIDPPADDSLEGRAALI